jgi:hypothetical protein
VIKVRGARDLKKPRSVSLDGIELAADRRARSSRVPTSTSWWSSSAATPTRATWC